MNLFVRALNPIIRIFGYRLIKEKYYIFYNSDEMQKEIVNKNSSHPVIFDVGAYIGKTSMKYKKMFPKSRIFAFEPFPESFSKLNDLTNRVSNIKTFQIALSDFNGVSDFNSNKFAPTNSLLKSDSAAEMNWYKSIFDVKEILKVKVATLDSVLNELGLAKIDLLKLDVQGAEPLVLKGAEKSIRDGKISFIYTEIITAPTYKGQLGFEKTIKMFYDYGYSLVGVYNYSYTNSGKLRQVDAIFQYVP